MIELVKVIMLKGEKGDAGSSGDYAGLTNKPSINGVTLNGNKTADDLNLAESSQVYTRDQVYRKEETYNKSEVYNKNEVYAKGDSFPDWEGKESRWDIIQISSASTVQRILITPEEDCYLRVGGNNVAITAWYKNDGTEDWWYTIGVSDGGQNEIIRPVKAGTRLRLLVPANTSAHYALIPTIG